MPSFTYTARDRQGERRQGVVEERDRRAAVERLQRQGLTPISLQEDKAPAAAATKAVPAKKPSAKPGAKPGAKALAKPGKARARLGWGAPKLGLREVLQFSIDLRDLLSAGMTLGTCIQKLGKQGGNPTRAAILGAVHEDIVQGKSLSEALAKHPRSFPEFYTSVIRAGEAGGQLQQALDNAVRHYERAAAAKEQMVGALVYPCIVAVFGLITIIACLVFVIPQFTEIFADLGQALPLPTAILIRLSDFLLKYGLAVFGLLVLFVVLFTRWKVTEAGRYAWHRFLLRVPVFSRVIRSGAYANFARTLSNLLTNGVPVLRALDITRNTLGNAVLEKEVASLKNRVTDGSSLSRPLAESGVFPDLFTDMLQVGEEAGEVPRSLAQIARRYDEELTRDIKLFTTVLEPVLMILIASAVAFVAISMLLPVFKLTQGIR